MSRSVLSRQKQVVGLLTCVLALCSIPVANAEDSPPAAGDVRTAYCIPVIERAVQDQQRMVATVDRAMEDDKTPPDLLKNAQSMIAGARQQLAQLQSLLDRMQSVVKSPYPDHSPLADAQARGASDMAEYYAMLSRCSNKCFSAGAGIDKCEDECQDKNLLARIKACFTAQSR